MKSKFSCMLVLLLLAGVFVAGSNFQPAKAGPGSQAGLAQAQDTDWWPMFRHDLNHTGTATSTAPNRNSTIWDYTTGGSVYSSPAVAGGYVYVGSDDYKVYAFGPSLVSTPVVVFVTFTESGLPLGTSWNVTFNGVTSNSSSNAISFTELYWGENESYPYTVGNVTGYKASPSTGLVTVPGADVIQITFTAAVPEFQSYMVLPLFMIATLVAALVLRKKRKGSMTQADCLPHSGHHTTFVNR